MSRIDSTSAIEFLKNDLLFMIFLLCHLKASMGEERISPLDLYAKMTKEQRERRSRKQLIRGFALNFLHGVVPPS